MRSDLEKYLTDVDVSAIDVVTFSGSGEPTLNPDLGKMVDRVRHLVGTGFRSFFSQTLLSFIGTM